MTNSTTKTSNGYTVLIHNNKIDVWTPGKYFILDTPVNQHQAINILGCFGIDAGEVFGDVDQMRMF